MPHPTEPSAEFYHPNLWVAQRAGFWRSENPERAGIRPSYSASGPGGEARSRAQKEYEAKAYWTRWPRPGKSGRCGRWATSRSVSAR